MSRPPAEDLKDDVPVDGEIETSNSKLEVVIQEEAVKSGATQEE